MYDQSVTCLADDPGNLAIRSNRRRTPDTLSQTNKRAYNKYSSKCTGKTQIRDLTRRFNLRTPVGKQSNRTKQQKTNGERKQLPSTNLDISQILQ